MTAHLITVICAEHLVELSLVRFVNGMILRKCKECSSLDKGVLTSVGACPA